MDERQFLEKIVSHGRLSEENLSSLLQMQEKSGRRLLQLAAETGMFSEEEIVDHLAEQFNLERVNLDDFDFERERWGGQEDFFFTNQIVPVAMDDDVVRLVIFDPTDVMLLRSLELGFGKRVEYRLAPQKDIVRFWDEQLGGAVDEAEDIEHIIDIASEAPVVRVVSDLMSRAVELKASDIHLEARHNDLKLRYRIDGILHDLLSPPSGMGPAIISRIKILSNLNIAERRLPQDGSLTMATSAKEVDVRVSVIPTVHGESVVLRILDKEHVSLDFGSLGLAEHDRDLLGGMLQKSYGMVVVAGPTGAGKTTTLYAAINAILSQDRKVVTIEDPVEFKLPEATQIQVNNKAGLTFASGLRSILRHDPDVILVGEIRDSETAAISIQSALTGHLVLSTLHANRASQVFSRLVDMEVEAFLASAAILGTISQRLVRSVCPHCIKQYKPLSAITAKFNLPAEAALYGGEGCGLCNRSGFKGRLGVYEVIVVNDAIQHLVLSGGAGRELEDAARQTGFKSMLEDGIAKALDGQTTIEEVIRVVG